MFKRVVLFLRPGEAPASVQTRQAVTEFLRVRGARIRVAEDLRPGELPADADPGALRQCDLVIAVGGDGTLLHAARVLNAETPGTDPAETGEAPPLLGINTGRLGFLTDIPSEGFSTLLEKVFAGNFTLERRSILSCRARRNGEQLCAQIAINDVGVFKHNIARLLELETWIDGRMVLRERADGVIVATPTGSTAYALAGGGPILHPGLHALELVPICPLALSHRPLVLPGASQLSFRIAGRSQGNATLTCDGCIAMDSLRLGDEVSVEARPGALRLLHPEGYDYYGGLRDKLRWGVQPC